MKNPRIQRLKIANPNQYAHVNKSKTQDLYGAGVKFMLSHMAKKNQKTLAEGCFDVYKYENWLC